MYLSEHERMVIRWSNEEVTLLQAVQELPKHSTMAFLTCLRRDIREMASEQTQSSQGAQDEPS